MNMFCGEIKRARTQVEWQLVLPLSSTLLLEYWSIILSSPRTLPSWLLVWYSLHDGW